MAGDTSGPWVVFEYEVEMFKRTLGCCLAGSHAAYPPPIPNAVVESLMLHTRILVDILLSRGSEPEDIKLATLLPGFDPPEIATLKKLYGDRRTADTPCWVLNKMLAHPTLMRSDRYDYSKIINDLVPAVWSLVTQIEQAKPKNQ